MDQKIYLTHIDYLCKYIKALERYDDLITKEELLFGKTQPHCAGMSSINNTSESHDSKVDIFLIQKDEEELDYHITKSKKILNHRKELLDKKYDDLIKSRDWDDIIYVYFHIKKYKAIEIVNKVPFEQAQVYRKINVIKKYIEKMEEKYGIKHDKK